MAESLVPRLTFSGGCPDCGKREVDLPRELPGLGDDFDWDVRDYDGFRLFMLEELAARFPERRRWTPADVEVVLVEALAAVLDQLSDTADRVAAESYLETARQPQSVYRLLRLIGYDAAQAAGLRDDPWVVRNARSARDKLLATWFAEPARMEAARLAGPRAVHRQQRMVTLADYAARLLEHPLVLRAHAWSEWGGAWPVVRIGVLAWNHEPLDNTGPVRVTYPREMQQLLDRFHGTYALPAIDWARPAPSIRELLRLYLDAYRMVGQEVALEAARLVGVELALSIRVRDDYFQSEVRQAVEQALGSGPGGFFELGRLRFGEDLYASDLYQALMRLDGVENVCLNRFKRVGRQFPDQTALGQIRLHGLEVAVCDNDPAEVEHGYYRLVLHGGRKG